jgi:hypothetical protein
MIEAGQVVLNLARVQALKLNRMLLNKKNSIVSSFHILAG